MNHESKLLREILKIMTIGQIWQFFVQKVKTEQNLFQFQDFLCAKKNLEMRKKSWKLSCLNDKLMNE